MPIAFEMYPGRHPFRELITKNMKNYPREATKIMKIQMEKAAKQEVRNTRNRLFNREKSPAINPKNKNKTPHIYDVIAQTIDYDVETTDTADSIELRFGSDGDGDKTFRGILGSGGGNIAAMVAFGKKEGKALGRRMYVNPTVGTAVRPTKMGSTTAGSFILPEGYRSQPWEEDADWFLPRASRNIEEKLKKNMARALRDGFASINMIGKHRMKGSYLGRS